MTAPTIRYAWKLRQVMAAHGLWKTSDLGPLLAQRGVTLSTAQVYRLAAKVPERLSLKTLAALCDIFSCTPSDLIELAPASGATTATIGTPLVDLATRGRPRRARVSPSKR